MFSVYSQVRIRLSCCIYYVFSVFQSDATSFRKALYFFTLSLHRMTHKTHQIGGNEAARSQVFSLHKEAAASAEAVSYAYALFCRPRRN